MYRKLLAALAAAGLATVAMASVTLNPDGTGFVGKGNVQLTFGWNNTKLQKNAAGVEFQTSRTAIVETTWTCLVAGQFESLKNRTATITVQRLLDSIGRTKTQITGFNLLGFAAEPVSIEVVLEGPLIAGSCVIGELVDAPVTQVTDPGVRKLQGKSTAPDFIDWTDIVEPTV
jgi:hypothetical protein